MERSTLLRVNNLIAAQENRQTILRLLQLNGPCSQRQLSQQTHLRPSTMSYIIRDLMRWGFIETSGIVPAKRTGRKEVLLKLDGSRGWTAGVDLQQDRTELVFINSAHEVLQYKTLDLKYQSGDFFKSFADQFNEVKNELGLTDKRSLGLGVSVAGAIDSKSGTVLRSAPFEMTGHPLGQRFQEKFNVPVLVEHNAICAGFAEKLLGAAKPYNHFLLFLIRSDGTFRNYFYGTAFYLNGNFYRGAHSSAGELDPLLATHVTGAPETAETNSNDFLQHLTQVIASLSNLFDPQAVILFADEKFRSQVPLADLDARVQSTLIQVPGRKITLHWNQVQNGAVAYGAALMQLQDGLNKLLPSFIQKPSSVAFSQSSDLPPSTQIG